MGDCRKTAKISIVDFDLDHDVDLDFDVVGALAGTNKVRQMFHRHLFASLKIAYVTSTSTSRSKLLEKTLRFKKDPRIFFAGQITGVEGYVESTAMGLLAGINSASMAKGDALIIPPPTTAIGSLVHYITAPEVKHFQPMNVNFGLFPPLEGRLRGRDKKKAMGDRALKEPGNSSRLLKKQFLALGRHSLESGNPVFSIHSGRPLPRE